MKNSSLFYLLIVVCFAGCAEPYYFLSPLNSTSQTYHAIPLRSDSVRSAIYANGNVTIGGANQGGRDNIYSFDGNISRSHNLGCFQAYYGVGLTVGNYLIQQNSQTDITIPPTDNFYGALGFNGAINLVIPLGNRGSEWRIIGIETSLQNEFGNYLKLRRSLSDSTNSLIETSNWTTTLGGYSEIIWKLKNDNQVGYKIGCGTALEHGGIYGYATHANPIYLQNTFHLTRKNVTGFVQVDAGTYTGSVQFGVNYRIRKKKM
ncbi:MAG TPA: hypothetical protein VK559_13245 [Ferruginibacter sp.]|nr:hypothetical protein [Ferruginibacter sp.]